MKKKSTQMPKTYAGLEKTKGEKKAFGTQNVNIVTPHEIEMMSVLHHTGELMRADAAVAQGAGTATTAECEQGCSVPTGQNRPLHLKTQSLTHTHSRSSPLTYIKANHSSSLIAWHTQIYGSERQINLPRTQTPFTLYLESQVSRCAI